jgi:hypothetical protein
MSATNISPINPGAVASKVARPLAGGGGGGEDRQSLRAAIGKREDARHALVAHKASLVRARELAERAEKKAQRARDSISEAKQEAARHAARAIRAGHDDPSGDGLLRAARAQIIACEDQAESLQAAAAQLHAETADHELAIAQADVEVAAEVRRLIEPMARAALEKAKALDAELLPLLGILMHVSEGDNYRVPALRGNETAEVGLQGFLNKATDSNLHTDIADYLRRRTDLTSAFRIASSYRSACESLRKNPEAPLP